MANYRNPRILAHAQNVDHCAFCGAWSEPGSIVAAHSNQSVHGKGMGIKAHDVFVAYLCWACHEAVDAKRDDEHAARLIWKFGHQRSVPLFAHLLDEKGWELIRTMKDHS